MSAQTVRIWSIMYIGFSVQNLGKTITFLHGLFWCCCSIIWVYISVATPDSKIIGNSFQNSENYPMTIFFKYSKIIQYSIIYPIILKSPEMYQKSRECYFIKIVLMKYVLDHKVNFKILDFIFDRIFEKVLI